MRASSSGGSGGVDDVGLKRLVASGGVSFFGFRLAVIISF